MKVKLGKLLRALFSGLEDIEHSVCQRHVELAVGIGRGSMKLVGAKLLFPYRFTRIGIHTKQLARRDRAEDLIANQSWRTREGDMVFVPPYLSACRQNCWFARVVCRGHLEADQPSLGGRIDILLAMDRDDLVLSIFENL